MAVKGYCDIFEKSRWTFLKLVLARKPPEASSKPSRAEVIERPMTASVAARAMRRKNREAVRLESPEARI